MFPSIQKKDYRVLNLVHQREIQDSVTNIIQQRLQITDNLILRLGLEKELKGHTGCVNCLEWNETGQVLASASDDRNIILWDPFRYKKKLVLQSGHNGNIFSVKFMPKPYDNLLVSGAGDCRIRMHNLKTAEPTFVCKCHKQRIKRIATVPSVPFLFWSVGEDGLVLQYDIRMQHVCRTNDQSVLVNLIYHMGHGAEGKCIAANPRKPELIAIGANDAYIRIYDRRMIKLSQLPSIHPAHENTDWVNTYRPSDGDPNPNDNIPRDAAQYFIAGHLRFRDINKSITTTYLTFSHDGNELLVNMGGEQIYLFDITDSTNSRIFYGDSFREHPDLIERQLQRHYVQQNKVDNTDNFAGINVKNLPLHVEELKCEANKGFEEKKYSLAIKLYNKAIIHCPTAATLFANRAAAYMKRRWDGDVYAALQDCKTTLLLDPEHVKAHFRMARCLFDLNRASEAGRVLSSFQQKFPDYALTATYKALQNDVKKAIEAGRDVTQTNQVYYSLSESEQEWRRNAIDYKMRFCGHCNTTTDIKEANFFGNNSQYIVAGSDDGSFFIWDHNTSNILRILRGDERIVNCLQPHPSTCLLATSGIESVIRLWSPLPEDGTTNERDIQNLDDAASANQVRMNRDPFDLMLTNMGYRLPYEYNTDDAEDQQEDQQEITWNCRPS